MRKLSTMIEIWNFLKVRKKWWLFPIIIVLLLIGIVLLLAESSAVSPFIYTVF